MTHRAVLALSALALAGIAGVAVGRLLPADEPLPTPPPAPTEAPDSGALEAELAAARHRAEQAERDLAAAREEAEAAAAAAPPPAPPEPTPLESSDSGSVPEEESVSGAPLTTGTYDEALAEVDWKAVGRSVSGMSPVIRKLAEDLESRADLDVAAVGKISMHNAALVTAALKLQGKLPGTGMTGPFNHPAFMANSMAAALEEADLPLDGDQKTALEDAVKSWIDRDTARAASYSDRTVELRKVLEEAELRERFFSDAFALMRTDQVELLSPSPGRGLIGFDLYSSGVLIRSHIWAFDTGSREETLTYLGRRFPMEARLSEAGTARAAAALAPWVEGLPEPWFREEMGSVFGARPLFRVDRVLACARETLRLVEGLADDASLDEESRNGLRQFHYIVIPVYRKPAGSAEGGSGE